jgi:protein ImuA
VISLTDFLADNTLTLSEQRKGLVHVVTAANGRLQILMKSDARASSESRIITTGLTAIDDLLPSGRFATGTVHEILGVTETLPVLFPLLIARVAARHGLVVWSDPHRVLYPPGLAAFGLPLERLVILRTECRVQELWAIAECLRCKAVAACVVAPVRLSRVEARRLQLAAERGGSIGLLLRPIRAVASPYAAATRWVVRPAAGERMTQRCSVELIHGHGGRVDQRVFLEASREADGETHLVRAVEAMADRQNQPRAIPASA